MKCPASLEYRSSTRARAAVPHLKEYHSAIAGTAGDLSLSLHSDHSPLFIGNASRFSTMTFIVASLRQETCLPACRPRLQRRHRMWRYLPDTGRALELAVDGYFPKFTYQNPQPPVAGFQILSAFQQRALGAARAPVISVMVVFCCMARNFTGQPLTFPIGMNRATRLLSPACSAAKTTSSTSL